MKKTIYVFFCLLFLLLFNGCTNAKKTKESALNKLEKNISSQEIIPQETSLSPKKVDSTLLFACDHKYEFLKKIDVLDDPFLDLSYAYFKEENQIIPIQDKVIELLKKKRHNCYAIYYSGICLGNLPGNIKLAYGLSGDFDLNQVIFLSFQGKKLVDACVVAEYFGDADDYSSISSEFTGNNIDMKKIYIDSKRTLTVPDTLNILKAKYFSISYQDGCFIEKLDSIKTNFREVKIWKKRKTR